MEDGADGWWWWECADDPDAGVWGCWLCVCGGCQAKGEGRKAADDKALHDFSSIASASVMATEDRTTEAVARKATTNDPANASFFWLF